MTSKLDFALLATILLCTSLPKASILPSVACLCRSTHYPYFFHHDVKELKIFWSGPDCDHIEIIVKMLNDRLLCLDPKEKLVQDIVRGYLDRYNAVNSLP